MRNALRYLLLAARLGMPGYCGLIEIDSRLFQMRAERQLEQGLRAGAGDSLPAEVLQGSMGRLDIPRLEISVAAMEGDSPSILRRAAGPITGTALPGQPGNAGISARRDTFFRPLRNVRKDDEIRVTTLPGAYRYPVVSTAIAPPTDTDVLNAGAKESLTPVTCYPFYFTGSAPDRFAVRAERII